ncbi:MAG: hypothetical protein U0168_01345 [Nannocystaceae bacterium]
MSRAWHTAVYPGGEACEDGCTSKGTDAPRCEASTCVAYRGGARDPGCTGVVAEPIAGPGLRTAAAATTTASPPASTARSTSSG